MTFYVDVSLAMRQSDLRRAGDRAVVHHDQPNSWADGMRVLIGEDAIDFLIVLGEIATTSGTVSLTVRTQWPQVIVGSFSSMVDMGTRFDALGAS